MTVISRQEQAKSQGEAFTSLTVITVSYLAGKNRRAEQDHKCFGGKSGYYDQQGRRQRLDPEVRMVIPPESEAVRKSLKM